MKRLTFLAVALAVLLVMAAPAQAQEYYAGILGGLNNAAFTLEDADGPREVSARPLYSLGGVFGLSLNKNFAIQIEPMYLQKGGVLADNQPELTITSSYLELPLLFKAAKRSVNGKEHAYLLAGPTVGFLLSSEMTGEESGLLFRGDVKGIQHKIDFGFAVGGGIGFALGKGSFFVEARYTFGLSELNKGGAVEFKSGDIIVTDDISSADKLFNKGLQLLVGYTIPIGK